jgi:benzoyl-CoA reductase/2-hydroxyglutaryl-CoA dehydratase subunit BcrC/BadD/HgdB
MRPEIKEYNYDRIMAGLLEVAKNYTNGTEKEAELAYRYIPNYKGVLKTVLDAGAAGTLLFELLHEYYDNIIYARERGKKVCGTTFCYCPAILYAMDIVPATFEVLTGFGCLGWKRGMFDYMDYCCEVGMPETSCSSQRGFLGAFLAGLCADIDFLVCDSPGVCDTNATAYAFAATYLDKPFYQLNYPSSIGDDRSQKYHIDDYRGMIRFIEEQSGKKLDYDRLAEVLKEVDYQDRLTADLEDMLMLIPSPLSSVHNLMIYAGRFCASGHKRYTELLEAMVEDAKQKAEAGLSGLKSGKEKLRVFTCYIDHYTADLNFWNYLEEKGIGHIGCILSRNFRDNNRYAQEIPKSAYGIDFSTPENMLDSMAQLNARMPMVRSIRGPYDQPGMWLEESLAIARLYQVDCVIYNGTPGCRNTWGMLKPFARDMERQGFPVHIMNDDAFDDRVESWEATRDRLEEFFKVRGLL